MYILFQGLTSACSSVDSLDNEPYIRMVTLFDNEEVSILQYVFIRLAPQLILHTLQANA